MASQQKTVDFILEQIAAAGHVRAKKMFGEYGIYCDEKMVAMVCDDQLFVKPTAGGRAVVGDACEEASPYPGAKPCLLISGEKWDDHEWMARLMAVSAAQLPLPKPKSKPKAGDAGSVVGVKAKPKAKA
jgi:TfoX/Sxy family transcriptional regulator of competence genes